MFYVTLAICFGLNNCIFAEGTERYQSNHVCEIQLIFAVETTRIMFLQNGLEPDIVGFCQEDNSI